MARSACGAAVLLLGAALSGADARPLAAVGGEVATPVGRDLLVYKYKYHKKPGWCTPFSGNATKVPIGNVRGDPIFNKCSLVLTPGQSLTFGYTDVPDGKMLGSGVAYLVPGTSKSQDVLASVTYSGAATYTVPAVAAPKYYILEGCAPAATCRGHAGYVITSPTPIHTAPAPAPAGDLVTSTDGAVSLATPGAAAQQVVPVAASPPPQVFVSTHVRVGQEKAQNVVIGETRTRTWRARRAPARTRRPTWSRART